MTTTMLQMVTRLVRQQDTLPACIEDALKMLAAQVDELTAEVDELRRERRQRREPDARQYAFPDLARAYGRVRESSDATDGGKVWTR